MDDASEQLENLMVGWGIYGGRPKWDWKDSSILDYPGLIVPSLTESEIVAQGKAMMQELAYGFQQRTAGTILILACHLTSPSHGGRVFPAGEIHSHAGDVDPSTLDSSISGVGSGFYGNYDAIPDKEFARGVCYLAASLLRLFGKPGETYLRAYARQIKGSYSTFYRAPFPFQDYKPSTNSLEYVVTLFRNGGPFVGTVGKLLYLFKTRGRDRAFLSRLFEQDIAMAGMHSVDLFVRICNRVNLKPEVLAKVCTGRNNGRQLATIVNVMRVLMGGMDDPQSDYYRQTWRYARLFDHVFFVNVQTKNCCDLAWILGRLSQKLEIEESKNIFNLAQLKDLSPGSKELYNSMADKIYEGLVWLLRQPPEVISRLEKS